MRGIDGIVITSCPSKDVSRFPRPWLLVFDLDGTLIDSSADLCLSVNEALRVAGYRPLSQQEISGFVGDGAAALLRRALEHAAAGGGPPVSAPIFHFCLEHFLAFYRIHKLDTTQPHDGVLDSLSVIRESCPEILMAVLTNKPETPSREICDALKLSTYFFVNYGGDSFATKKPAVDGLMTIMQEARLLLVDRGFPSETLTAEGVVMIGDSEVDVVVGRACGTRTLGCSYGLSSAALLATLPDLVVETAREWPTVLNIRSKAAL